MPFSRIITIDGTKVQGTHTNFPIKVDGTYPYLRTLANGGSVTSSSGFDIWFTDSSDTPLQHEVGHYDGTTGDITMYVNIPSLSAGVNTEFKIWYGDSTVVTATENKAATWQSDFRGVYHFKNGDMANDSSSYNRDADISTNPPLATAGINGYNDAALFNGVVINSANSTRYRLADFKSPTVTISTVLKTTTTGVSTTQQFVNRDSTISNSWRVWQFRAFHNADGTYNLQGLFFDNLGGVIAATSTSLPAVFDGTYHHMATSFNGVVAKVYFDGVLLNTSAAGSGTTLNQTDANMWVGEPSQQTGGYGLNGSMDELRLSATVRNDDYIKTEYNNVMSPATFYSIQTFANEQTRIQMKGILSITGVAKFGP